MRNAVTQVLGTSYLCFSPVLGRPGAIGAVKQRSSLLSLTAAVVAGALIGVGGGAATYAALLSDNTKTVLRQVTVSNSQPASRSSGLSVNAIYKRAYRGVVEVKVDSQTTSPFGGSQSQSAEGSGFVYDGNGHIVTNQHVVAGATSVHVTFWNGSTYPATVVGTDPSTDLAVLEVNAPSSMLYPLALGDSGKLQVGDNVVAIGAPFGLAESVTAGIVSALHRSITSPNNFSIDDAVQTDAAINHGNSGGPLLNAQGQVVGVNSQIESDSGGNDGVGFAIPSNTVKSIASQLISGGKAEHAYLGVELAGAGSARVVSVRAKTPAAKAGLRAGDVIRSIDGTHISSAGELRSAINARNPGDRVSVGYTRNGKSHTVSLTLAARPS
jgi:putative serine protease PepD